MNTMGSNQLVGNLKTPSLASSEMPYNSTDSFLNTPSLNVVGEKQNTAALDGFFSHVWTADDWYESYQKDTEPDPSLKGPEEAKEQQKIEIAKNTKTLLFIATIISGYYLLRRWF